EAVSFTILPLEADLPAGSGVVDADRHGPAGRPEHPALDQLTFDVSAVDGLGGRAEASCDENLVFSDCGEFELHRSAFLAEEVLAMVRRDSVLRAARRGGRSSSQ